MKILGAVILFLIVFIVGVQVGISHGRDLGYIDGWSDAHCGKGLSCESGEN